MDNQIKPVVVRTTEFNKSNFLINLKYSLSLPSNKLFGFILYYMQNVAHSLKFEIPASDILAALGETGGGSFYKKLIMCSAELTSLKAINIDSTKNKFSIYNIFNKVSYEDGVFSVSFVEDLEGYLLNLSRSYTKLNIQELCSFSGAYTYRLYELLKSQCFDMADKNATSFTFAIDIQEFRFQMGTISISSANSLSKLISSKMTNYMEASDIADQNVLTEWRDLKKRCIDPSCEEINKKTSMRIQYEPIRQGKGGRVTGILFKIDLPQKNVRLEDKHIIEEVKQLICKYVTEEKDIVAIIHEAKGDISLIEIAFKVLEGTNNVDNPTAFMIKAIRNGYKVPKPKRAASSWPVEQHDDDYYKELEEKLISN